jgi:hypothetical protein
MKYIVYGKAFEDVKDILRKPNNTFICMLRNGRDGENIVSKKLKRHASNSKTID